MTRISFKLMIKCMIQTARLLKLTRNPAALQIIKILLRALFCIRRQNLGKFDLVFLAIKEPLR